MGIRGLPCGQSLASHPSSVVFTWRSDTSLYTVSIVQRFFVPTERVARRRRQRLIHPGYIRVDCMLRQMADRSQDGLSNNTYQRVHAAGRSAELRLQDVRRMAGHSLR